MISRRTLLQTLAAAGPTALFGSQSLHAVTHWLPIALPGVAAGDAARDEDFWRTVQEGFAVDRAIVNLNNGGVSPSPRTVQDGRLYICAMRQSAWARGPRGGAFAKRGEFRQQICLTRRREEREGKSL